MIFSLYMFVGMSSLFCLSTANHRYGNTYAPDRYRLPFEVTTLPPEGNVNYIVSVMRQELQEMRVEIKNKLEYVQYGITSEMKKLKKELKKTNGQLKESLNRIEKDRRELSLQGKHQSWRYDDILSSGVIPMDRNRKGNKNRSDKRRTDNRKADVSSRHGGRYEERPYSNPYDKFKGYDIRQHDSQWYEERLKETDRLHENKWMEDRRHHERIDEVKGHQNWEPESKQLDYKRLNFQKKGEDRYPTEKGLDFIFQGEAKRYDNKAREFKPHENIDLEEKWNHGNKRKEERKDKVSSLKSSSRLNNEVKHLKKKLKKSLRGISDQGEEIKNELRSQKAEMFAIRNSVYDTREDLQEKGNIVLRNLQSTNASFMCYLNDLRMHLFKINANFGLLKRDQERMKDLIIMSQIYETEETGSEDDGGEGDSLFGQQKYLPGCTPNPLETQETLQTFGSSPVFNNFTYTQEREYGYFPVNPSTVRPRQRSKGKSTSSLYPAVPENCLDPKKIYLEYPPMPRDCRDVYDLGFMESGVYRIQPPGLDGRETFCDHTTAGGGWTVILARRKVPRHIAFNRTWHEYENGFGDPTREFWLGLKSLHVLSKQNAHQLRADMEDWDGNIAWAAYNYFTVAGPEDKYRLRVSGYSGNAGDSMRHSHLQMFSTVDQDNDQEDWGNCARGRGGGGWWWGRCACTQPTGQYRKGKNHERGITWHHWKDSNYSLKTIVLMIKPRD